MSNQNKAVIGAIEWRDLTVENADQVKDFYTKVIGWQTEAVSMGDYDDFNINLPKSGHKSDGDTIAGVCHARGGNANLPAQWLMYVRVADVQTSVAQTLALGGNIINGPKTMGKDQFCVIQDPAGAVIGLVSS